MRYEDEIVGRDAPKTAPEKAKQERSGEKNSVMKSTLLLARDIAIALLVLIAILIFIKPTIVFEHSMEDTLYPEDYVFLARQAYTFGEVRHGDIVVFESKLIGDHGTQKSLIKRVIGKPGDVIEVKDEAVYRNGERLDELYTKDGFTPGVMAPVTVPENSYFVMGDNRQVSMDSRNSDVGFIPGDKIKGKVIYRLFPISKAGIVR